MGSRKISIKNNTTEMRRATKRKQKIRWSGSNSRRTIWNWSRNMTTSKDMVRRKG